MTLCRCLSIAVTLCCFASIAHSDQPGSAEVIVNGEHAVIDVPMHSEFATFLVVDSSVKHAFSVDQDRFHVEVLKGLKVKGANQRVVFVKPSSSLSAREWGNVVIMTEDQMVSVRACMVAKPADALIHVVIKTSSDSAAARPVFAQTSGVGPTSCGTPPPEHSGIARLLLDRSDGIPMNRSARHGDVLVRVDQGQWVGPRYFLLFEVDNRGRTDFRVAHAEITGKARTRNLAGDVHLVSARAPTGLVGIVPAGEQRRGIIEVVGAAGLKGTPVTLSLSEPHGKRKVRVSRIALAEAENRAQ